MTALVACNPSPEVKEEILSRYSGGEKKIVAFYLGQGSNEKLIERITFDKFGEIIKKEDLINNTIENWLTWHREVYSKDGLSSYLKGEWIANVAENNKGEEIEKRQILNFQVDSLVVDVNWIKSNGEVDFHHKKNADITYHDNLYISLKDSNSNKAPEKIWINIVSEKVFNLSKNGKDLKFHKLELANTKDEEVNLDGLYTTDEAYTTIQSMCPSLPDEIASQKPDYGDFVSAPATDFLIWEKQYAEYNEALEHFNLKYSSEIKEVKSNFDRINRKFPSQKKFHTLMPEHDEKFEILVEAKALCWKEVMGLDEFLKDQFCNPLEKPPNSKDWDNIYLCTMERASRLKINFFTYE